MSLEDGLICRELFNNITYGRFPRQEQARRRLESSYEKTHLTCLKYTRLIARSLAEL